MSFEIKNFLATESLENLLPTIKELVISNSVAKDDNDAIRKLTQIKKGLEKLPEISWDSANAQTRFNFFIKIGDHGRAAVFSVFQSGDRLCLFPDTTSQDGDAYLKALELLEKIGISFGSVETDNCQEEKLAAK